MSRMPEVGPMQFARALDEAAGWLDERQPREPCVVAVDGHSAAGKSTFADALASRTGAALARGDDFYRVMDEADRAELAPAEGVELYYDWQRMRDEVLLPLRAGTPAQYHPYDWDSGSLASRFVKVPAAAVVILEGLFVSRPELQPLVDRSVLVDTPAAVRRRRQTERADASPEWLERWDAAERYFFRHVRPPRTFDLVVRGY
jgi:uridine kinase